MLNLLITILKLFWCKKLLILFILYSLNSINWVVADEKNY